LKVFSKLCDINFCLKPTKHVVQSDNLGQDEFIFGEDINLNVEKTLYRDLTLYIEPLIPVNTTQDDINKISTTDMLSSIFTNCLYGGLRMEMKININANVYIYKRKKPHT
jgi:hypothetical protein